MSCSSVDRSCPSTFAIYLIPGVGNVYKLCQTLGQEPAELQQAADKSPKERMATVRKFENNDVLWMLAIVILGLAMAALGMFTGGGTWLILLGAIISFTTTAAYIATTCRSFSGQRGQLIQDVESTMVLDKATGETKQVATERTSSCSRFALYAIPVVGSLFKLYDLFCEESSELSEPTLQTANYETRAAKVRKFDNDDRMWLAAGFITMIVMMILGVFTGGLAWAGFIGLAVTATMVVTLASIVYKRYKQRAALLAIETGESGGPGAPGRLPAPSRTTTGRGRKVGGGAKTRPAVSRMREEAPPAAPGALPAASSSEDLLASPRRTPSPGILSSDGED